MYVLVTYDVRSSDPGGEKRLRKVAKVCTKYGQRVQYSVFECLVDPAQYLMMKHDLMKIIDKENDSLRFYNLGKNWKNRVEHVGAKGGYDPEGAIIV